ncbi:hypothetical protein AAE478_006470 [Parahypoxylon ruwenzoriense]
MSLLTRTIAAVRGLIDPWLFISLSLSCLPGTIMALISAREFGVLLSPSALREAWFAYFWRNAVGPGIREGSGERVKALLRGRVSRGRVLDAGDAGGEAGAKSPNRYLEGVVIEVGAGAGFWVDVFPEVADIRPEVEEEDEERGARKRRSGAGKRGVVTRILGVEPNPAQHPQLRRAIARAGLESTYQIVPVGIEDLGDSAKWGGHVEKGSVDCIVTVLCLCSIPEPERNIRELYGYLKKGGRWYVYEHVKYEHSWYMAAYQRFLNLIWPHLMGGCMLCRSTEQTLRAAGPWERVDIGQPTDEEWWQAVPHILGVFTK